MELNLSEPGQSRYLRVYEYYKELIVSGQMKPGAKLPSIRKCSLQLQLSRTTVETAYMLLAADGYIISRPQSGFYVTDAVLAAANREEIEHGVPHQEERPEIRYDFASSNVDRESFQFDLWRRYVKSALRQDERLLSYGEPQGEREFREALCAYLGRHRNVICTPDSIVVGAGVQSLLHILCPMLRERDSVWFFNPSFRQGRQIFEDYGFRTGDIRAYWEKNEMRTGSFKMDLCGTEKSDVCAKEMKTMPFEQTSEAMKSTGKSVCYLTPSQMTVWGEVMPVGDRMKLLKDAEKVLAPAGFDIEIVEKHHNQKVDAPSGTAIALADSINEAMADQYVYNYDRSHERKKREKNEIGIVAVRGGTIVGQHDVIFAGADEVIEFHHTAYSKAIFGKGAVEAAKFLAVKPAGMYDMSDVIGLLAEKSFIQEGGSYESIRGEISGRAVGIISINRSCVHRNY